MDLNELNCRFFPHKTDEEQARRIELIRETLLSAAVTIDASVKDGREKSLALTHLEEVGFWAVAGVAREPIK